MSNDIEAISLAKCYEILLGLRQTRLDEKNAQVGKPGQSSGNDVDLVSAANDSTMPHPPSTRGGGV